jgi:fumarate reductase flavoprotein subunit
MSELSRRRFIQITGGSAAVLSVGLSQAAISQPEGAKALKAPGGTPEGGQPAGSIRNQKMKELEADVAVIGGGCAGMAAAATAADLGLKVAVFEKQEKLAAGGNGPFAVESRMQRERHLTYTVQDALEFYMKHTHHRADARLVKAYLSKSASTIDWFEGMGINFIDLVSYYPGAQMVWHYKDPNGPAFTDVLAARTKSRGAVIYLQTPARELTKANGRVTGLIAEAKSGEAIRMNAKAVVIGAGGFGENIEMVEKYTRFAGYPFLYRPDKPMITGDGVRMAWEAGAGQSEMWMDSYRSLPVPYSGAGGTANDLGVFRQPILMVNQAGERFVNEEVVFNGAFAGNAVDAQKGRCAYGIFDEDTNRHYEENDWDWVLAQMANKRSKDVAGIITKARNERYQHLFMTDSIEELCSQTGINPDGLRKTLNEYNKACDTGRDELLFKNTKYLRPVRKPKFYAGRFYLNVYGGLGGIKINHKTEAMTRDFDVIPGLYCAGNDVNSICGGSYPFYLCGHTSGFAYNTGRIAGENASAYIKALKG